MGSLEGGRARTWWAPYRRWPALTWIMVTAVSGLSYVAASWFPFELELPERVPNRIEVLEGGLRFSPVSLATAPGATGWFSQVGEGDRVEIALRFRTASVEQYGPARLLAIGTDLHNQALIVGQQDSSLVIRSLQRRTSEWAEQRVDVLDLIEVGRWLDVQIAFDDGISVVVDRTQHVDEPFPHIFQDMDPRSRLSLGAETSGLRTWAGDLAEAKITVDDVTHDLLVAPGVLETRSSLWLLPERLDETGSRSTGNQLTTAVGHLLLTFILGLGFCGNVRSIECRRLDHGGLGPHRDGRQRWEGGDRHPSSQSRHGGASDRRWLARHCASDMGESRRRRGSWVVGRG